MSEDRVKKTIESLPSRTLDLLHFFQGTSGGERSEPTFLGGSIRKRYCHVKPLIDHGLLEVVGRQPSYAFYRDKLEDFIFRTCEEKISRLKEKASQFAQRGPNCAGLAKKCECEAARLSLVRNACRVLLSYVRGIRVNGRFPDPKGAVREGFVRALGSFDLDEGVLRRIPDRRRGLELLREMARLGFWEDFPPANLYRLTELGLRVQKILEERKRAEKSPEEEEFEELVRRLNL